MTPQSNTVPSGGDVCGNPTDTADINNCENSSYIQHMNIRNPYKVPHMFNDIMPNINNCENI